MFQKQDSKPETLDHEFWTSNVGFLDPEIPNL